MSRTEIHTLDTAPQAVAEWLSDLREILKIDDAGRAYMIFKTVLHTLRDWTPIDEAAQLSAQMPILVRGIFYEGWNPKAKVERPHDKKAFVQKVNVHFESDTLADTEEAIAAVFKVLKKHISAGEINDIKSSMTHDLQEFWD